MNCPYCGGEMESGIIHQTDEIFWTPKKKQQEEGFFKSLLSSVNSVRLIEIKTKDGWIPYPLEVSARHCPKCQFFLFRGRLDDEEE